MSLLHYRSVAWALAMLVPGLVSTGFLTRRALFNARAEASHEFDASCREIRAKIDVRMAAHEQILRSSAAFFADSDVVTRSEFRDYVMRQKINETLPGIQGLGFVALVPRAELEQHLQKIRAEGFPTYRIWPEGDRETYTSVIFLEPFADRNLRAFGYDMFTEPVRRAAMERARDLDVITLSGKVDLVLEDGHDVQAGTLMYAPVYRRHPAPTTVAERHAAFLGWIFSTHRMGDLRSAGILGSGDLLARGKIRLEIFDGETATPAALLYASQPQGGPAPAGAVPPAHDAVVEHAGRHWLLRVTAVGGTGALADYRWAWLLGGSGTFSSVLLAGLAFSLASTQMAARRQAARLTADLRQSEQLYRELFEMSADALLLISGDTGRILDANSMLGLLYGYERDELLTMQNTDLSAEPEATIRRTHEAQLAPGQAFFVPLCRHRKRDGTLFSVEITARSLLRDGQSVILVACRDITARQQAEAQMRWKNALLEAQLEATIDGVLIVDGKGKKFMQNQQCAELWQIPKDIADSQDDFRQIDFVKDLTTDPDQFVAKVRYLYSHPNVTSRDEVEFKDGMILDRYSAPIIGEDGTNFGRIWVFRDITARQRAEAALLQSRRAALNLMTDAVEAREQLEQAGQVLRASEEKYRTLVENLSSGIVVHRPDSSILFANAAAMAMLGLSEDQLLGKTAMDPRWHFLQEDGSTMPLEAYPVSRVIAAGEGFRGQILGIHRPDLTEPTWVLCNAYVEQHDAGQLKQVVVTFVDITVRKQAEKRLTDLEKQTRAWLENSPACTKIVGLDFNLRFMSSAGIRGLGIDDITPYYGKPYPFHFYPESFKTKMTGSMNKAKDTGEVITQEAPVVDLNGNEIWFHSTIAPVKDESGRLEYLVIVSLDTTERKRAEEALRHSEERLQLVMQGSQLGYWDWNLETGQVVRNARWAEMLGYDFSDLEFTVKQWADFVHPDDLPQADQSIRDHVDGLTPMHRCEYRMRMKDGTYRWILDQAQVVKRDAAGRALRMSGTHTDVTERKQAEDAVKLEQTLTKTIIDSIPGAFYMLDEAGCYVRWNIYQRDEIVGQPEERIAGMNAVETIHPEDRALVESKITNVLTHGGVEVVEGRVLLRGGPDYRWLLMTGRRIMVEGRPFLLGIGIDVSEQKQAEAALLASQARFRTIVEKSPMGMHGYELMSDGRLVFIDCNPASDSILGLDSTHFIGKTIEEAFPELAQTEIPSRYREAALHGTTWQTEQMDYVDSAITGAFDVVAFQTEPAKMAAFFNDVTKRKQAEAEVRLLNQTLEQRVVERTAELKAANAELESFSYSVSHDLRAPLRAMDGFSAALLEDCAGKLNEAAQDHLQRIRAGSQRMGVLIDDLLNLSRESRAAMRREPVDLTALVHEIGADLRAAQPDRCSEWVVAPAMAANADARMVRVVLRNLLGNAWKFTARRPGTRIEVGVLPPAEAARLAPPETLEPGAPVFFVRDNGAGFDMAYADKLFGAFQRLHSQREFEGTGIGLALVQRIIRRHGGCVWATGKVNEGATFYFTLEKNGSQPHEP